MKRERRCDRSGTCFNIAGIPPFFLGKGENSGRERSSTLAGIDSAPSVLCDKPLACFCLLRQGLLFFLPKALAEAVGLADKLKNVSLAREPV